MRHSSFVGAVAVVAMFLGGPTQAEAQNPLVGSWERVSLTDGQGKPIQPPLPAAFLILSADGFFSQTAIPTGRQKIAKPLDQMSKEELLQRFTRLEARRGTYTTAGNRLIRRNVHHGDPVQEGTEQTQLFRIEGDILVLSSTDPKVKNEARFRRAR